MGLIRALALRPVATQMTRWLAQGDPRRQYLPQDLRGMLLDSDEQAQVIAHPTTVRQVAARAIERAACELDRAIKVVGGEVPVVTYPLARAADYERRTLQPGDITGTIAGVRPPDGNQCYQVLMGDGSILPQPDKTCGTVTELIVDMNRLTEQVA